MEEKETLTTLLRDEIASQIKTLNQLPQGSKEHAMAVKDISELYQALTKELDSAAKADEINAKFALEERRLEQEREEAKKRIAVEIVKALIGVAVECTLKSVEVSSRLRIVRTTLDSYANWLKAGFEFEEKGCFTSSVFRNLSNKMPLTPKNIL